MAAPIVKSGLLSRPRGIDEMSDLRLRPIGSHAAADEWDQEMGNDNCPDCNAPPEIECDCADRREWAAEHLNDGIT